MRARATLTVWLGLAVIAAGTVARAASEAESQAAAAATSWLALVDAGKYGASWDAAAAMFRSGVARSSWERMAASVRGPLGELRSRQLAAAEETSSLPGAPAGHYVVLQFKAAFANKADTVETVTMVLEGDRAWRTVGYFIR